MAKLTGNGMVKFVKGKLGTPYIYGCKGADGPVTQARINFLAKNYPSVFNGTYLAKIKRKGLIGKTCCDCSGLISWYTGKVLGSAQLYSTAYARMPISEWKKFAPGTVVWKNGHVGVYIGDGKVIEERGIDYGCITSNITDVKWQYGLTFSWMQYDIATPVESNKITYKKGNPYTEPTSTLKKGDKGAAVKWLQYELVESGYSISIDGSFGISTENALIKFQKSAKITVDGLCGKQTRAALIADTGNKK